MRKLSTVQIRNKSSMVKKVMKHHFGVMPKNIEFKPAGLTNFVFEAHCKGDKYIVRIADERDKLNDFTKEQWAVEKAKEKKVPVAEILEVGSEIIGVPYMLQQKLDGEEAANHPERLKILLELGKYAKIIHSIQTNNYGEVFDWSKNRLSKNSKWINYLHEEWKVPERIKMLEKSKLLSKEKIGKLNAAIKKMEKWNLKPSLNHGDLRLKNVIVNKKGKIIAIIDWENCTSHIAPYWDLSIALHDLSIDGKQQFLDGYGISAKEYVKLDYGIKVFNILNYTESIEKLIKKKDRNQFELYKLRLNGHLDMFSL
jgi:aminoglycoside phosphotransferase (APT) family kinase protein